MQVIVCYSDMARKSELAFCRFLLAEQKVEWGFSSWRHCSKRDFTLLSLSLWNPPENSEKLWAFTHQYWLMFLLHVLRLLSWQYLPVYREAGEWKKGNYFNSRPKKTNVTIRCRCFSDYIGTPILPMIGGNHSKLAKWRNMGDIGSFFNFFFSLPLYTKKGKGK